MQKLDWKIRAENDLFDILNYIGRNNPDAAVELVQKSRTKVNGLREHPTRYRAGRVIQRKHSQPPHKLMGKGLNMRF